METVDAVRRNNEEAARRVNEEALANPQSTYFGKFVGFANGQIIVVANSLDDVVRRLDQVEADPRRTFYIEAGLDHNGVEFIWRVV